METTMLREIQRLRMMTVGELREEWKRLYGEETRSRNRDFLWRRLAWRVQELAHGGLSGRARAKIEELAPAAFMRAQVPKGFEPPSPVPEPRQEKPRTVRDPRLPSVGTVIVRRWRGRDLRLVVLEDGYEMDGAHYGSFTEAARAATGSHWNGRLFWGVTQRSRRK